MKKTWQICPWLVLACIVVSFLLVGKVISEKTGAAVFVAIAIVGILVCIMDYTTLSETREPRIVSVYSPPPEKPPFLVSFLPCGEPHKEAIRRSRIHFEKPLWVHSDGTLQAPPPFIQPDIDKCKSVELQINFNHYGTESSALALPKESAEIKKLEPHLLPEAFRLCVTKEGDPDYIDYILFENGSFILESVRVADIEAGEPQQA